jgi:predicted GH43/DUF377 family glycosyl hydrolase
MAKTFQVHQWEKHPNNPVLPPGGGPFDAMACMNPFALRVGDEYYLFYAGGEGTVLQSGVRGNRRICLAIAPVDDLANWQRLGPLFDLGAPGHFDEFWNVLPCVHRIGGRWHLYYTGRNARMDLGLQAFAGMGLAVSDDLLQWRRHSDRPVLDGSGFAQFPDNKGIAGGARIQEVTDQAGRTLYRMHYTLPTGTPSKNLLVDQAKFAAVAHSYDGINWFDKRIVLRPRLEADYENAAVIALNTWKTRTRWRAIYAGIGTRFGAYSICEAVSEDGETWERGAPGENLSLPPSGTGWESRMTEYPNVIEENGRLRLFYCGNGYGTTGIGTATAAMLD